MTLHGTYIEGEPMEGITPGMLNRIEVSGQKIVLPTHDPQRIQLFNEYTLNPNRCALVETPWGGLKGSSLPDNSVGTVRIVSGDGCYLSDINGNNVSKTLQSGKLAELGHLSVDTTNHKITEEFVIQNTGSGSDVQVIDDCSSVDGWSISSGTGTISVENNSLKLDGVSSGTGTHRLKKTVSLTGLSADFFKFTLKCSQACSAQLTLHFAVGGSTNKAWHGSRFNIAANTTTTFVLPLKAPQGTTGQLPSAVSGTCDPTELYQIEIGVGDTVPMSANTVWIDDIQVCNGTWAQVEVAVPDILSDSDYETVLSCYGASAYAAYWRGKLNGSGVQIATSSVELKTLDSTTFNDIYNGGSFGRGVYAKGEAGEVKQSCGGVAADITYSSLAGTSKRIGLAVCMPPSDNGRTEINKVRLKLVTHYDDENGNTVPDLSGNGNHGTIVGGVTKLNDGGLQFDGSTGYVSIAKNATESNHINIKLTATPTVPSPGYAESIFRWHDPNGTSKFYIDTLNQKYRIIAYNSTDEYKVFIASSLVAVNDVLDIYFDATSVTVYLNGVAIVNQSAQVPNFDVSKLTNVLLSTEVGTYCYHSSKMDLYELTINDSMYALTVSNMGSTTHEFSNDNDLSTGLYHLAKPWVGLLNEATGDIEYFVFSNHPDALQFTQNDAGEIYEIAFDPGNGNVSHGIIRWVDQSTDSDSDYIPDCLDEDVEASLADMLHTTDFITILNTVYDLSTSSVVPNDFSITADDVDCFPFAVSYGNSVTDGDNNPLTPIEIVSTATGDVAIYDVKGHPTIKVHDSPGNNAGDCMVWDTVTAGNTNESTWVRVYDVNHVFTGDCVAENGLIRSIGSKVDGLNAILSYHNGSTWKSINVLPKIEGNPLPNTEHVAIVSISPDAVITRTKCMRTGYIDHVTYDIILTRGSKHAVFVFVESSAEVTEVDITGVKSFGYMSDGGLLDTRGNDPNQRRAALYGASLPTDSSAMRILMSCSSRNIAISPKLELIAVASPGNTQMIIGAIPYPIQTYFEAESLNFASNLTKPPILPNELYTVHIRAKNIGTTSLVLRLTNDQCATMYTGEDCYPFSGNTGVTLGSHIVKEVTFSEIGSEFGYGKADIMLTQEELDRVTSWQIVAPEANSEFILDYVLFVPTGMLDRYAKRSLVNLSPMTSTLEKTTR